MSKKPYNKQPQPKTVKIFGTYHTYIKFPKNTSLKDGLEAISETVQ
mgnify:CR=1 FL=1